MQCRSPRSFWVPTASPSVPSPSPASGQAACAQGRSGNITLPTTSSVRPFGYTLGGQRTWGRARGRGTRVIGAAQRCRRRRLDLVLRLARLDSLHGLGGVLLAAAQAAAAGRQQRRRGEARPRVPQDGRRRRRRRRCRGGSRRQSSSSPCCSLPCRGAVGATGGAASTRRRRRGLRGRQRRRGARRLGVRRRKPGGDQRLAQRRLAAAALVQRPGPLRGWEHINWGFGWRRHRPQHASEWGSSQPASSCSAVANECNTWASKSLGSQGCFLW